jgi:hypothetical protein
MKTITIENKTTDTLRKLVSAWYTTQEEKIVTVSENTFFDPISEKHKTQINFYN